MMDLATIRYYSRKAARESAKAGEFPYLIDQHDADDIKAGEYSTLRHLPFIGDRCPRGYKRVRLGSKDYPLETTHGVYDGDNHGFGAFFVDNSGFGHRGEPALNLEELAEAIRPGFSYAVVEAGQFQVKVGVFARKEGVK